MAGDMQGWADMNDFDDAAYEDACTEIPLTDEDARAQAEGFNCTICSKPAQGMISTGDIKNPLMLPCCNACLKNLVIP